MRPDPGRWPDGATIWVIFLFEKISLISSREAAGPKEVHDIYHSEEASNGQGAQLALSGQRREG